MNTNPFKKSVYGKTLRRTKKYALVLPLVVVTAVLLAFSTPAAADYSGDYPLTLYEHDTINGSLIYETVTDGSKYKCLWTVPGIFEWTRPILYQNLEVNIPVGATVKTARLYNTYCWSCWGGDDYATCPPAQARLNLTSPEGVTWTTVDLTHSYTPENRDDCPNPIVYTDAVYGNVTHYWDTKNLTKYGGMWDFPSGEFAWNVTGLVTGSGTYNASIVDPRDKLRVKDERFCTFGFGLLVIYEHPDSPEIEYWVTEGCDILIARNFETPENATTSATFAGSVDVSNVASAELTAVNTCADGGLMVPPTNMMYFNDVEIGPAVADGICHYGVNVFDVRTLLRSDNNVVEFQDRDDDHYVHNAFLVLEAGTPPPSPISATVSIEPKTLTLGCSENFTASISLPEGYDVANIDISTVECGGAPALSSAIDGAALEVTFSMLDLVGMPTGDAVELTVTGELTDETPFKGSDTVSVKPLWESYSAIASGLEDVGDRSTPAVFNMSGTWYLIAGESDGTFNGYIRTGTAWVSDPAIVSDLEDVGVQSTPAVFNMGGTWYLISGRSTGDIEEFVGYRWTGTAWEKDDAIVSELETVVSGNTAPAVFCMDGTWYLISGNAFGRFDYGGRRWNAATSTWVEDSDIVLGLGDVGEDSTPTVFNADGTWHLIAGAKDGSFTSYKWTGTVWKSDLAIVSGLENVGEYSAPAVFNKDETWYLISGDTSGTFNGFKQVCGIPPIPANVSITPQTLNLKSSGEWITARIELSEEYNVSDIDVNTTFLEGTIEAVKLGDGVFKFDRAALIDHLGATEYEGETGIDEPVTLTVTGKLVDETPFEGCDTVRVIKPGH